MIDFIIIVKDYCRAEVLLMNIIIKVIKDVLIFPFIRVHPKYQHFHLEYRVMVILQLPANPQVQVLHP